jgi:hypothetical protein
MRRRDGREHGRVDEAMRFAQACSGTPLASIGIYLQNVITTARLPAGTGASPKHLEQVAELALDTLRRLPKSFGERFRFDALMLQAMSTDWSKRPLFSRMLLPNYGEGWGHASLTPPGFVQISNGAHVAHVIDMIFFRGRDELAEIDLLVYPWIAHELAHNLLFRHEQYFVPGLEGAIDGRLKALRIAAIADRGTARSRAHSFNDELLSFWFPTRDHRNWMHEIAADIVALYVLGPAYLAVFEDLLESTESTDPYRIAPIHPPYMVRIAALMQAACHLGWEKCLTKLEAIAAGWPLGRWREQRTNRLLALADPVLISNAVQTALHGCQALQLNACTPAHVSAVEMGCMNVETLEAGTDLLLAAWLVYLRAPQDYNNWERTVVETLVNSVTL